MRVARALLACPALFLVSSAHADKAKKLIEYGWDCPDTRFVRENIARMETVPFDGVVIKVQPAPGSDDGALGWSVFSTTRFKPQQWQHALADLRATRFHRFTDNFIQAIDMPGVDWFDPSWRNVAENAADLARVAKQGRTKGLMLDLEDYGSHLWSFPELRKKDGGKHTWEEYVARIRECGRTFIRAVNREYPDIAILCLIGPAYSYGQPDIRAAHYGLLYSFFDGMCEAATPATTITDGFEQSYPFSTRKQFEAGRRHILELSKTLSAVPEAFTRHMRAGFGTWVDNDSGRLGWAGADFRRNYFTPESIRAAMAYAMESSDRYVWVYTERLRWWDFGAPQAYVEALALAKQGPGPGGPPSFRTIELPPDRWRYRRDETDTGEQQGWQMSEHLDSDWVPAQIGAFWEGYGEGRDRRMAWYRTRFSTPGQSQKERVYLAVGGAAEALWVWVNGKYVGGKMLGREGSERAVTLDITDALRTDRENVLAVRVRHNGDRDGLWRPVRLLVR